MSKGKVIVLGINGHIGHAVAEAFVAAGWDVSGMGRSDKHAIPGVHFVKGDADSVEDMRRAIGDIERRRQCAEPALPPLGQWPDGSADGARARGAWAATARPCCFRAISTISRRLTG